MLVKKWWFCVSLSPLLVVYGAIFVSCDAVPALSLSRTRIYGPGIHPKRCSLPINYFYIQAIDTEGNSYKEVTETTFEVSYEADGESRVRRRLEVLNLRDGLILHQFRIFHDYQSLSISVTYRGKHVAHSPYRVGPVLHEDCSCPLRSIDEWMGDFDCPETDPQILEDLEPFRKDGINVTNLYERGGELFPRHSFIHYSIVDGKVYAQSFGSITGFKFMSDMFLLSVANKMRLPDMELVVNLGDWPLNTAARMPLYPVFSWCGSPDTRDIIWPTWDIMKSTVMGLERVSLTPLSVQKTRGEAWEEREPRAFFRGRDSNRERLDLVRLHRNNTELFDVALTNWFFFTKEYSEEVYGPKVKHVSFHDFFKYKYQINIDGTVAAYRFPYLMGGGSLILKQDSHYYEHFYRHLRPWVHYVPVKRDISDIVERLEWALEHDDEAREMAGNAYQFLHDNLLPQHLYCYIARLLSEYSQLIIGTPTVHPGMEPVVPEKPHDCSNTCKKMRLPDMELVVNLGDWPLNTAARMPLYPVFSWCGSPDTRDIIWPTWDIMKSTVMGLERVSLTPLSVQKTRGEAWEEREPRAFFRGRDSNRERLDLVRLHRNNTELFDVALTNWFFFTKEYSEEVYGPKVKHVSFHDFFKYKYQINIDGTVAAYRFPYLMGGGSLILKQDSHYYEHFYRHLRPWVHYVPVKRDISDIVERVEWALEHDDEAREMAGNAYQFLHDNLLPQHLYCYIARLLSEYSQLIIGTPTVHPGMEPVVPEKPHDCSNTCKKMRLPDMELVVNLGDWPLNTAARMPLYPVFSWCGSPDTRDIIWPTWDIMKSTVMGLERVSLTPLSVQKTRGEAWEEREPRAFFRGRDSNRERLDLVRLHRNNTELFDVALTNWFFFTKEYSEEVYGPKVKHVSFHDFFKYKYQINIDGTVAAYRFPYLMGGGSLILKQDSHYYEHFYRHLRPWVHYVPVKRDISDIVERLEWALEHDDEAREMAGNAYQFLHDNLLPQHLYCYIARLLSEYSQLIIGTPTVHPGMEPVVPEKPHDCSNTCKKMRLPDMELVVNLGDWPLNTAARMPLYPVFSWCGSPDTRDIIWPTWDIMKSTVMGLERVSLTPLSVQKTRGEAWEEREPRAFFRGRDSNRERLDLVRLHRNNTELFDVALTNWFFFTKEYSEEVYGPKVKHVSFHDFFKYKYQININGTVAAYRFPYLMGGGSLILKQDSHYYEHFYRHLRPWVHYVPVKRDISDIVERLEWALEHDDEAREMAGNAYQFLHDNLLPQHLYCYIARLLSEYSQLIIGTPTVHPGMEPVVPEKPHDCSNTCKKMRLPDMELVVNLGDWPLNTAARMPLYPVFSWCGSPVTRDIIWPTWDIMKSTVMGLERVSLTPLSVQKTRGEAWEEREPRAFFRGRDSNRERLDLVRLHRNNTELFDVALTNWFFFTKEYSEEVYGPKVKHVSFHDFFKYKYQINIDGTVAAYRFPYLMGGGSLILKQDSHYYEHFYRHLRPWVHYVPVKRDISDIVERLEWALEHDDEAREMAGNAYQFLHDNLLPQHLYCYIARLLSEYSQLIIGTPTVHPGMEPVVPEKPHDCSNTCKKMRLPDMELVVNLGDWPLNTAARMPLYPVFSWCGSPDTRDIIWPTWDIMKSTVMGLERVSLTPLSVQKTRGEAWEEREPRAFFRGRDSNRERLDLVRLHRNNTELFDVALTNWFFFTKEYSEEVYGPKYKYQINIDGTVAAYRFPYLMGGGSLILKQDSHYYEHFYRHLRPWVHYVPVKRDISDIVERLEWALEHDDEAREMAGNAYQFLHDNLLPQHLYCYIARLLSEYSQLIIGTPTVHPGMEPVVPEKPHDCSNTCKKMRLPDMELVVNLGDWPLNTAARMPLYPVFSWCGSPDTRDIIWPTWDIMKSTVMGLERVSLTPLSVQKTRGEAWEEREPRAFFRGRDSNRERLDLVRLHRNNTELFDVALTNWFFFTKEYSEEVYGPKVKHVSFHDFFKYKYQINIDGTVAAYRFPYLMGGGSLILKQDSHYYEHLYRHLRPWVHYVPVKRDISDIVERLEWALEHDDEAREMAGNAYQFLHDNLLPQHLYCYIARLLSEYSQLIIGTPTVHPGMEPVVPEKPHDCSNTCKKMRLPDMELVVNLGDWPLNTAARMPLYPVFSWCGSPDTRDIIWPTWDIMKSTVMGLERVSLTPLSVQKTHGEAWEEREPRAFFRGRDSNRERLDLVRLHRNNTELFDVALTNWFFFTKEYSEEVYGPKVKHVSFHDFFKYKYQINIDGTVAAYRFPYLMGGGSLILKQDSHYYEHFYRHLRPWVHYVPVKRDISDIVERLEWALEHDDEAREMAGNAYQFLHDNLLPQHLYCYIARLLSEYSQLIIGTPTVHPGMEPVVPEKPHDCSNTCKKMRLPDMELVVNLGDWPLNTAARMPLYPVFSWCGSPDTRDIIWPTWDIMKSTVMGLERVSLTPLSVQKTRGEAWEEREPRAFFRGRDSNRERLDLVRLHKNNTELFDVALTNWFFFTKEYSEEVYGPKVKHVSFHDFFKYKYQINIDGTVAAYRFPYLMGGGSLILKQDSHYYEHFYRHLRPWVHYVPVKRDISDIVERLEWALEHDDEAREMAGNAYQFLHDNLLPQHLYCYIARLLSEYSQLIIGTPTVHPGMEPVVPEKPHDCSNTCKKMRLPDMELVVNLGDWPLNTAARMPLYPVFSWCGFPDTRDIIWPTWDIMKSTVMGLERVSLTPLSVQKTRGEAWEEREPRAFFRGRDSNRERLDLVRLHRNNTELFDVALTNWFFFTKEYSEEVYGPKVKHVSFHDFFKYKYQINIDGTVAAYRFPYLMGGGSLILKQDSHYYEHFYRHLRPWVQYVPVKRDISDIVERLEWALEHDDEAREMAGNAYQFLHDNLLPQHLYCYIARLLSEYSQLIIGTPTIHPGMEPVVPEKPHDCSNTCKKLRSSRGVHAQGDRDEL